MPGLATLNTSNPRKDNPEPTPIPRPSDSVNDDDSDTNIPIPRHRFLSPAEWAILARGVGASLLILQLFLGAALTALGPQSVRAGTPITVLGAINTITAGLLALLHNSGLPDRYRYNGAEFEELEDHIHEILDTGLAHADQAIDQILAGCFDRFQDAKATVQANMPVTYNSKQSLQVEATRLRQTLARGSNGSATLAPRQTETLLHQS